MKKITTLLLLVCLVGSVITGCGNSQAAFKTFTPEDNSFSVDLPKDPEIQTQSVNTALGEVKMETFSVKEKDIVYAVARNIMPEKALNQSLDEMLINGCNNAVASTGGTNAKIEDITVEGYTAKYVTYDINDNGKILKAHQKLFLVDNTLYQLMNIDDNDDKHKENREKFFNSFKIIK